MTVSLELSSFFILETGLSLHEPREGLTFGNIIAKSAPCSQLFQDVPWGLFRSGFEPPSSARKYSAHPTALTRQRSNAYSYKIGVHSSYQSQIYKPFPIILLFMLTTCHFQAPSTHRPQTNIEQTPSGQSLDDDEMDDQPNFSTNKNLKYLSSELAKKSSNEQRVKVRIS